MKMQQIFLLFLACFCGGCGKKTIPVNKDADFWYKKSLQELRAEKPGELAWRSALASIDQALALDNKRDKYWVLRGSLLLRLKMPTLSVESFEQALVYAATPSQRAEVLNNYACALAELGEEQAAFARWREALVVPSYQTPEVVYCNQGQYWLHKKEYTKALAALDKAINLSIDYSDAYFFRALALYHLKQYTQAQEVLFTLLALDPDYQPALELKQLLMKFLSPQG